jgi:hypothetical protein
MSRRLAPTAVPDRPGLPGPGFRFATPSAPRGVPAAGFEIRRRLSRRHPTKMPSERPDLAWLSGKQGCREGCRGVPLTAPPRKIWLRSWGCGDEGCRHGCPRASSACLHHLGDVLSGELVHGLDLKLDPPSPVDSATGGDVDRAVLTGQERARATSLSWRGDERHCVICELQLTAILDFD